MNIVNCEYTQAPQQPVIIANHQEAQRGERSHRRQQGWTTELDHTREISKAE